MQNVLPLRSKFHAVFPLGDRARETHAPEEPVVEAVELTAVASDARQRVTISSVELGSLASLAVRAALLVALAGAAGVLMLWVFARSAGFVGRAESFMQSIGFRDFHISDVSVVVGLVLVVGGFALTAATMVVLAGAAYNVLARRGSGVRMRIDALDDAVSLEAPGVPATQHGEDRAEQTLPATPLSVAEMSPDPAPAA
jgi:hypothetical protein